MHQFEVKCSAHQSLVHAAHSSPHSACADDGSSCSDMISRQTALSPGLFACPPKQTVVFSSTALNSHCCFSFHQAASSKPSLHLYTPPPPLSFSRLSHCVSSLPQRWARGVSLKRIRDIYMSPRGRVGHFFTPVALLRTPPPFSLRDQVLWFGQIKTSFMLVGTVSDYTVRHVALASLTNLPCRVGRVWGLYWGGGYTRRFTVIELSLSSDPARRWCRGLTGSVFA